MLLSRFPYPLEKGDKLRAFHQIKELSKQHEIILCALSDVKVKEHEVDILRKYCASIEVIHLRKWKIYWQLFYQLLFTDRPMQVAYFYDHRVQKRIDDILEQHKPDHIYCQLIRVAEYVKFSKIPKTLDFMDALARGIERRAKKVPFYMEPFFTMEAIRLKRYEHFVFNYFDNHVIISEQDKQLIVHVANDTIEVVPNGVDYDTYKYKDEPKTYDVIFSGNMSYAPNVDSAIFLVKEIMPLVWKKYPDAKLTLVGAKPSRSVLQLRSNKVNVTGWVDDISDFYAKSKIFIAPMQIGTGLQNKLLEAMAMKLPCITSPLANNALGAQEGHEILIGNSASDYANHIINLLSDNVLLEKIADKGHEFIKQNYTWKGSTSLLEKLILKTK